MASPQPYPKPGGAADSQRSQSPWVYALVFTSFGLFALAIISPKYARRQTQIEQEFHGIEQMQRGTGAEDGAGQGGPLKTPRQQPLLITLRPLMFSLAALMLAAWAVLVLRASRGRPKPDSNSAGESQAGTP